MASNVVSKLDMLLPKSSVSSIYAKVAAFCVALFNLILPVPGSEDAVLVSKV